MYLLKFESFELQISDFVSDESIIAIDATFESENSFKQFKSFYYKHIEDKFSFKYELDNVSYFGHFGLLAYDSKFNVRFYLTTTPDSNRPYTDIGVLKYNLAGIINNHEIRINKLIDILLQKGILTSNDAESLSSYLTATDKGIDLKHEVPDLNKYLVSVHDTLDDIRNELKKRSH